MAKAEFAMIEPLLQQLASDGQITFTVRAHPGAKQTKFKSIMADGALKIDLAAAPEDGKANQLLISYLAELFTVAKANIELLSGETSRIKQIRVQR